MYAHQQRDDIAILIARLSRIPADHHVTWQLPAELTAVKKARHLIREPLERWELADLVPTTELLVSELVTNAIRYAIGEVTLRLVLEGSLVCEVMDHSAALPRLRHAGRDEECGRGLEVVSQFAQRWGARRTPAGKVVWCEQQLPGAGAAGARRAGLAAGQLSRGRPGRRGQVAARRVSSRMSSLPFCMMPIRWARRATALSWVTRTRVMPASPPQLFQQPHDVVPGALVQVPGRLVGQQHLGLLDQGPGDGHPLLLAAGQLRRQVPQPLPQPEVLQRGAWPGRPARPARCPAGPAPPPRSPAHSAWG